MSDVPYPPSLLRRVQKPIRYVGGEYNHIRKDPAAVASRVALVFPDTYEIGMSHWGSRLLYHVLNRMTEVAAERVYCPWPDMEAELRRAGRPLCSLESGLPLREFHLIGISLLYELTFSNVLTVLDLGGVPLLARERDLAAPLVLGGGPVASNPEPVADFFDLIVVGDGEEAFPELVRLEARLRPERSRFASRGEYLRRFTAIPGVYAPGLYSLRSEGGRQVVDSEDTGRTGLPLPVIRRSLSDLEAVELPVDLVVPNTEIVHDRVTAEISRGCMQGCRFCHAGIFYRPQRERDAGTLVDWIQAAVARTGYEEVSLASLSSADFGGIETLAEGLIQRLRPGRVGLSFPSLRVNGLSERLAAAVAEIHKTGFTVAPEAGTQRMRDRINKNISEPEILEGILAAYRRGWDLVKLYFMIGLPFETDEDVAGIAGLVGRILDAVRREPDYRGRRRRFQVTVSVSSFVPKAHTPFQWAAMDTPAELQRKQALLRRLLPRPGAQFKWHEPGISRLEGIFARGDRRLAGVILEAWRLGARLDGWNEWFRPDLWEEAFRRTGIDPDVYLAPLPPGAPLPWSHISMGVNETFLAEEWAKTGRAEPTPACGLPAGDETTASPGRPRCFACGNGCDLAGLAERRRRNLELLPGMFEPEGQSPPVDLAPSAPALRIRLAFTKRGPAAWMSHLDLVRTVQRILRRAGLPIWFTAGFHPHPQVSFSPALGVGTGSREEFADVALVHPPEDPAAWLDALNRAAISGIRFLSLRPLAPGESSIEKGMARALYRIDFPASALDAHIRAASPEAGDSLGWLRARIEELLARPEIPLQRQRPGRPGKIRNIRALLLNASADANPDGLFMLLEVSMGPQGSLRPEDWVELCLPGYGGDYAAERLEMSAGSPEPAPGD
jgi:radical SAM family uncharacterized protein/radical SAM-linked protein